jgi:hypothetical protein
MNRIRVFLACCSFFAFGVFAEVVLPIISASAIAEQKPPDLATDLRQDVLALSVAYNHAMKSLDLYMTQAAQDAQMIGKDEADLKWLRENPWVPALPR